MLGVVFVLGGTAWGFDREHQKRIAAQTHADTILAAEATGSSLLDKAVAALSQRDPRKLNQVQEDLAAFHPTIKKERQLAFLSDRITEKRKQISDQLAALQSEQANRDRFNLDREQLRKFRALRNQAQLYAAKLMVLDPAEHQKALLTTALAALSVYGQEPRAPATAWSLVQPLPEALDLKEKDSVKAGSHDLLLMLSEAMDPVEGLKVLDRAALLLPRPSVGDHLLRAALFARSHDVATAKL